MKNFELYNPTRLIFGENLHDRITDLIPQNSKVLLAYGGGSIFKNGVYEKVSKALVPFEVVEFGGIEPNPRFETLMKAVQLIREKQIDFILAVGGGSVIDGVKFISAAVKFEGDPVEILQQRLLIKDPKQVVPFGAVVTLPATGSEMNSGGVITIEATHEKLSFGGEALFPVFSIADPTVIQSLPKRQLQNGVVDSFVHVLEQYLTYKHDAFLQDRIAEGILQTLIEVGPQVIEKPEDYTLASNFMWCCTMALNGLLNKGVPTDWVTHMIGHELTAMYEIDHARTLAIIGPNLYKVMFKTKKEKLAQYGERVWGITGKSEEETAREAIEKTIAFYHTVGIATKISEYTAQYQQSAETIVNRFKQRNWVAMGEKQNITPVEIEKIVAMAY